MSDLTRKEFLEIHKARSLVVDRPVKVQYNDEKFVFEHGKLIEYELDIPLYEENSDWTFNTHGRNK